MFQFDGKSCGKLNERHVGNEERFFILCHAEKGDIPLGFFALNSNCGVNCAAQIIDSLDECNLAHRIMGMVRDTENTNTGIQNGTCALVEADLEMELFHLMCRHHVKDVQLKDAFVCLFGRSQPANIDTFDMLI